MKCELENSVRGTLEQMQDIKDILTAPAEENKDEGQSCLFITTLNSMAFTCLFFIMINTPEIRYTLHEISKTPTTPFPKELNSPQLSRRLKAYNPPPPPLPSSSTSLLLPPHGLLTLSYSVYLPVPTPLSPATFFGGLGFGRHYLDNMWVQYFNKSVNSCVTNYVIMF